MIRSRRPAGVPRTMLDHARVARNLGPSVLIPDAPMRKSSFVTEHHLQAELARRWAMEGIPGGPCERTMLLGWEVMLPSWRINDARLHWNEPSADFVGIDCLGHLVIIELKVDLRGVKRVLDAASQLTAAALLCERSAKQDGVRSMLAALSLGHNDRGIRIEQPESMTELLARHQRFFHLRHPLESIATGTQRVLAVRQPGPGLASKVLGLRTPNVAADLDGLYEGYSHSRIYARLARLLPIVDGELCGPMRYVEV